MAAKFGQLGFINHTIRIIANQHHYDGIVEMDKPKLATDMYYDTAYADLVRLIELAAPTPNATEQTDEREPE